MVVDVRQHTVAFTRPLHTRQHTAITMALTCAANLLRPLPYKVRFDANRRQRSISVRQPVKVFSYNNGTNRTELDEDSGIMTPKDLSGQPLGPTETCHDVYGMHCSFSDEDDAVPLEGLSAEDLSGEPLGVTDSKWEMPGLGPLYSDSPFCFGRSLDIQQPIKLVSVEDLHGPNALSDEADMVMYDRLTDADLVGKPLGPTESKWEVTGRKIESDQEEAPGFGLTKSDLVDEKRHS